VAKGKAVITSRLGLEFLMIVVGILAALAVDDWRQSRSDRALEEHLLASLAADLADDQRDAELQVALVRDQQHAVDHLLVATRHPLAPMDRQFSSSPEDIDHSLATLLNYAELQVFDATYTEMIATGSIRVIRNPALRRQISSYYQTAEWALAIPLRQIDPRPELLSALAAVGVAPGQAAKMPDLVERLRSSPAIATHALRVRQYYKLSALNIMNEAREPLAQAVHREIEALR